MASHHNGAQSSGAAPQIDTDGSTAPPPIEDTAGESAVSTAEEAESADEPTDYLVIFAHYINETLSFEKSLARALGLNLSVEGHDLAAGARPPKLTVGCSQSSYT